MTNAMRDTPYISRAYGTAYHADSLDVLASMDAGSVDLIMTSPPFALVHKKAYGNEGEADYIDWFKPFGRAFHRVLKDSGSLVIDIAGAWQKGQPTRSLYHFKLLIMLCEEIGFHLAQELYWWNPATIPSPAEWVSIRRIRVKSAVNSLYWLSKTPWPKASNRRVLQPYSDDMLKELEHGYRANPVVPSGHRRGRTIFANNGASIPPNLLAIAHVESNSRYLRYCRDNSLVIHPARFPSALPEYFVRMLTDENDLVVDPFGGSCTTGEVCERLHRRWVCSELDEEYLKGAQGRFVRDDEHNRDDQTEISLLDARAEQKDATKAMLDESNFYRIPKPGVLWNGIPQTTLPNDGGRAKPVA